ncbi:DUF4811 domain-containing protein [Lactobacillaceae bacterium Scapto_B20]
MIILALAIGVIGMFISFIYIKNIPLRSVLTVIFLALTLGSTYGAIRNDKDHFMMEQKTTTTSRTIYATKSSNGLNMMVYQNLGTAKQHDVQTYRKASDQKNPSHTQVDSNTTNKIKYVDGNKATLKTATTNWEFTKAGKFWFGIANMKFGNDKSDFKIVKRVNTFYIPKNWIHLSSNQAKALGKQMKQSKASTKQQQAAMQQQAQSFVQTQMKVAVMKNPKLATDKDAQAKLAKQFAAEFKAKLLEQQTNKIKNMVKTYQE